MKKLATIVPAVLWIIFSTVIIGKASAQNKQPPPQLGKNTIKEVIAAMTLEEKAQLVVGKGFKLPGDKSDAEGPQVGQTKDKVAGAAGTTLAIPRLGIPSIVVSDGPAGVRIDSIRNDDHSKTYYATAWPVGALLASSWDTALVKKAGAAFGNEVHEYGIDILLGPGMNIHRNPLGGRNFEYYSEDPLVSGSIAAAMVNGIQSNGVGTSIKHFVANNEETNRNTINVIMSERALREIYLKGFEIAVKGSRPWTVMSSYNLLNGSYTSESHDLLSMVLRKDWGYKGFVMSDWFGGKDPVAQMKAGNNLLMPGRPKQTQAIIDAVKAGTLDEKMLDENIAGILNIILKSPAFKRYKFSNRPDLKKHAALSRSVATEGMVLLKNTDNALPIKKNVHSIALFGINGYDLIAGGTGSGDVNKAYKVSLAQGLSNAGYLLDPNLKSVVGAYLTEEKAKRPKKTLLEEFKDPTPPIPELATGNDGIAKEADAMDMAIISIGRNSGEGNDRKLEGDYYIGETEKNLLKNVTDAFHAQNKKVIVVLNIGGVIDVMGWRDAPDAILLAWQPGLEGGNSITDVLTGKVNPSGRLATTFPATYNDVSSAKNFPGKEFPEQATKDTALGRKSVPAEVVYEEGIYIGYRYYNTFHVKTAYEFGYGLSYTRFGYSNLALSSSTFSGTLTATVTITNSGSVAGKEVVQLYLSAPEKQLDKPSAELRAFAKTNLLQPGQSQTITFVLHPSDLASFDEKSSSWLAEAGTYKVAIGASSTNFKLTKTFTLARDLVTEKTSKALMPQVEIKEMKGK